MKYLALVMVLVVSGCGYSSRGNEVIGQVKKVTHSTPLVCFDRTDADISLGVMVNGTGSMSTEDMWATVYDKDIIEKLKKANELGSIVKIKYDKARIRWCAEEREIVGVELVK